MSKIEDQSKFVAALRETPLGRQAESEIAKQRLIMRRTHVQALAKIEAEAERDNPKRWAEIDRLKAAHDAAVKAVREAGARLNQAVAESGAASMRQQLLRSMHEGELIEDADPAIRAFMSDLRADLDATRTRFASTETLSVPNMEGRRTRQVHSNAESVNRRTIAIHAALDAAAELLLKDDQAGVLERLAFLRASLPEIEPLAVDLGVTEGKR